MTFIKDVSGNVTGLMFHEGGQDVVAQKVEEK
jgi:hypothetical protein